MVYNPPVERGEDGEPIKDGGVALTHPVNPMRRGAYVEQATRATGWAVMYILGWLLMRLSCYAGLPGDCNLPDEPLEVLTVLLVLLVFSLAQAWFCEIMEERRFRDLASKVYFPLLMVGAALALSGLSRAESLRNSLQEERRDLSTFQVAIFIILLILTVVVLLLHFAEAWKVLPGAHLISGVGVPRVEVREDLLSIYVASRMLILAYFILYAAFSVARDDGWGYQLYLLAWVLSLFAQFKSFISVFWLAVTTGVFLQGIGVRS
ncbi:unnamed protein product, partial [Ectocarpus sp. 8 AP-2014]